MAKQVINTGSTPNARDGDTLYSAFNKVNANFTEVYTQLTPYTAGTGISVTDKVISVAAGYTGQTSITTVSDTTGVTTGVWKATAISPQYGGTGLTTTPIGAMVYGNGTNTYGVISPSATDGGMLRQDAEGAPYWTTNIDGSVQTIKVKQLSVQSAVPAVNDIELGEIVVNTYDGKLFSKKNNGTESIFEIGINHVTVATYAAIASAAISNPSIVIVTVDETNDNLRTHYFYDGATLFWLPAVEAV